MDNKTQGIAEQPGEEIPIRYVHSFHNLPMNHYGC